MIVNLKAWIGKFTEVADSISNPIFIKFVLMVLIPIGLILSIKNLKHQSGIYFGAEKKSFLLSLTCYYLLGPASVSFAIIGLLGLSFKDWYGSMILTAVFLIALYFIPKITRNLPTFKETQKHGKGILILTILSLITVIWSFYAPDKKPILYKLFYYFFIVGVGEEVLFRGYLQSSFNICFGKKFKVGGVAFGWRLILAALLFGLIHSLVTVPIIWPWMLFTFVTGLILG